MDTAREALGHAHMGAAAKPLSKGGVCVHQPSAEQHEWVTLDVDMEPEARCCVQYWYLFAFSHPSYLVWLTLGILLYACFACLMSILDSGCHVCFCKVGFVQTHASCNHVCQGDLYLSVKLIT